MIDPRLQEKGYDGLSNATTGDTEPGSNTPESPGGGSDEIDMNIKIESSSSAVGTTGD